MKTAILALLIITALLVSGCVAPTGGPGAGTGESEVDDISGDISELGELEEDLDLSELDNLEAELDNLNW